MDLTKVTQARALLDAYIQENSTPTPPQLPPPGTVTTVVRAGQDHLAAIAAAQPGDVLAFEPATYVGTVKLTKPITLQPTVAVPIGRRVATFNPVTFIGSDVSTIQHTNPNGGTRLIGITGKSTGVDRDIVDDVGVGFLLDRVALLGDPVKGQRRGLAANGTNAQISQSLIDDCFRFGADSQAIMGWNGTNGLVVDDCALYGGAETVMFGGATAASAAKNPQHIVIKRSLMSKKTAWYGMGVQIKNAFELKNALHVTVVDSVMEYGGIAEGQGAYVIVLTPRNQDNDTPWATVKDVLFERCVARHGAGGASMLGKDTNYVSDVLDGVTFRNVLFDDLTPAGLWGTGDKAGAGRVFAFDQNPRHVTIDSVTVRAANMWAAGYFMPLSNPTTGLVLKNIVMPSTVYSWKIDDGGQGLAALKAWAPDAQILLTSADTGAVGYPTAA